MIKDEKPTWEKIKKLEKKINHIDHMDRRDPDFKKFLNEIENELESMKFEMLINKQK